MVYEELLALQDCVVCKAPCAGAVCRECRKALHERKGKFCSHCGIRLVSETRICLKCRETQEKKCYVHSLWIFTDIVRSILYHYKQNKQRFLCCFFAQELQHFLEEKKLFSYHPNSICIIPLPANPLNVRERGFDQSYELARRIGRKTGISVAAIFQRKKNKEQKKLKFDERKSNIEQAIKIRQRVLAKKLKTVSLIILLDDLVTTGATMQATYQLLQKTLLPFFNTPEILGLSIARID